MGSTLFFMVAFALGWRLITSKGYFLHFLRKPFENLEDIIEAKEFIYKQLPKNNYILHYIIILKLLNFISKPFIICITCFASIWGGSVYATLNGISIAQLPELIILMVSASFIQTAIWNIYERYIQ